MRRNAQLAIVLVLLASTSADASEETLIVGRATVVDGDTVEIRDVRIRLHGIDAPESSQRCTRTNGESQKCGQDAAFALHKKLGHRNVRCAGHKTDRWRRKIATCFLGSVDVNKWMVQQGWALAYRKYSTDYVATEASAKANRRGIWSTSFIEPWKWRRGERTQHSMPKTHERRVE